MICQDYVLSGTKPVPYIIVSDGCSSSERTDVGARIIVHLAEKYLNLNAEQTEKIEYIPMGKWIIGRAKETAERLGLHPTSLDATLMIAWSTGENIRIHVYGDGIIGLIDKSGNLKKIEIGFTGNAPYYLSYLSDSFREKTYRESGFVKVIENNVTPPDTPSIFLFSIREYPIVVLASDGLGSFVDKSGAKADASDILCEFTAFKNVNGLFLKRRVKRAVRDLEKNGWMHYDDISVAAMLTEI